ncbi:MAG: CDP-alcohol phosphatidyltransferase family protein [Patescibacteria group bacterium]
MSTFNKVSLKEATAEKPRALKGKPKTLTTATLITTAGILATALYVLQYTLGILLSFIPMTVGVALLSDVFDGFTARKLKQQTHFGELIDCLRDRSIVVAGAGNIAVERSGLSVLMPFCLMITLETYSFLKKDCNVVNTKKEREENSCIRSLYILSSCGVLALVFKVYWNFPLIPPLWFFMILFAASSLVATIEAVKK